MRLTEKPVILMFVLAGLCAAVVLFWLWPRESGDTTSSRVGTPAAEGFSFFDVGANARYSGTLRETLQRRLGPATYETRTPVVLELPEKGLLARLFPRIDKLNRRLNGSFGERVEHDTVQLTFRYARKKGAPFVFVRLIFSSGSGAPLFFNIQAKEEGLAFLEAIEDKYGMPLTKPWPDGGKSHIWEKSGDCLIISETTNRIGVPLYHFAFYFTDHIEALLETEEAELENRREAIEKKGQSAF